MPVVDFEVVGSFNSQRVIPFDPERSVNLFEYIDPLGKKPKALLSTSGYETSITFPLTLAGESRATFVFQGVGEAEPHMYQVFGTDVYLINQNLSPTFIFSFASNVGYVGVDANSHQVIFVDGQQGFIWDVITQVATLITDPAFPVKPIDVCSLDNFFVVAKGDTNEFQLSAFDEGLVWGVTPATTFTDPGFPTANLLLSGNVANFQIGTPVQFTTATTLPNPLQLNTTYFVVAQSGLNIQVAATNGGTPITLTDAGTGVHSIDNGGQLQQGEITSHPGNIVACRTLHRRLFLFSVNFTEVWENQGVGANLPFRRNNSLLLEYGTPALGSIATGFDTMIFLSQDKEGLGSVMEVTGTQAFPVSNRALDFILSGYAHDFLEQGVADARSFLIKENGLIFYRLNFTRANHTYVYDVTLSDPTREEGKLWHEEEVLNGDRHPAQTHGYFIGKNYVGSYLEPKTFHVDSNLFSNSGEAIRRMRITRSFVPPNYTRIRIDRLQLDLLQGSPFGEGIEIIPLTLFTEGGSEILTEGGDEILLEQGIVEPSPDPPQVYLSISKDGGQTFGYITAAPMGSIGQRSYRTLWRKLGTVPRGQGFVAKIQFFNQYPFAVLGAAWAMDVLPE